MKMEETARKAQFMVGLGPINKNDFNKHIEKEHNYNKAKLNIVNEHLRKVYKYDDRELEEIQILETKATIKDEIYIYIAVDDTQHIKNLYRRRAEIKRDDAILRSYVPPQFFARFIALNKICKTEGSRIAI